MIPELMLVATLAGSEPGGLQRQLDAARRTWDVEKAEEVLAGARALVRESSSPEAVGLQVGAALAVAEMLRLEWEESGDAERRRVLGSRMDAIAGEARELLGRLGESSERERLRADLIAVTIRSDFRAKRAEADLRAAIERALELDEGNARAWVSAAKPPLFAPPGQGRDLDEALRLLNKALAIEPGLEQARLLRARVLELRGERAAAIEELRAVLKSNPDSRPARDVLDRLTAQDQ